MTKTPDFQMPPKARHKTRSIRIGGLRVGGTAPISVQSMCTTDTRDVTATITQIHSLEAAGCEIIRVAVPDMAAAEAIRDIRSRISIPLVADIHFDHRLAVAAAEAGADGLRINPGNIGSDAHVRRVVDCCKAHAVPIRIGVNAGSLEKNVRQAHGGATPAAMMESALGHLKILTDLGFDQVKLSLKASDVPRTVAAYRGLAEITDFPLHIGVTEAGGLYAGITKSAVGLGLLLAEGIGDTLRVSLTRDPVEEVRVGFEILRSLGLREFGPEIISCPTCGRCEIDLFKIAAEAEAALMTRRIPLKVAIMGCVVNGPGEAKEADIGIAGGRGVGLLFKKGEKVRKVAEDQLVAALLDEIDRLENEMMSDKAIC